LISGMLSRVNILELQCITFCQVISHFNLSHNWKRNLTCSKVCFFFRTLKPGGFLSFILNWTWISGSSLPFPAPPLHFYVAIFVWKDVSYEFTSTPLWILSFTGFSPYLVKIQFTIVKTQTKGVQKALLIWYHHVRK
jgi:hypothetical protein